MEPISSLLLPAITETVFGALAEATGLSDWLRQRLGRDPERLAFQSALTQALTVAAHTFPGRDLRYFTETLRDVGGPLLARTLQPAASWPTPEELTQLWLNHLTIDSAIHYCQEFAAFATLLLDQLNQHIENQQPLQWIVQARRQRSSEEATRRLAEAAEQGSATLHVLQQELVKLTDAMERVLKTSGSNVTTAGGAYVAGSVSAHNFAGRDLTIKNYFVAGLPRLVIDYSSRIQDFLLEYLGSKRKRVPFGGRQQQLEELHAWLDDPMSPPYYLMIAEAGRGKSALVCRWLAQLTTRPALDVIFVPISLRFETATQDVVFAALAARLANLYESEPEKLPPASLTAEQWKGVCQSYLRRSPTEGKQLLVILDGLDEATGWTPSRGLFSSDPPDGIRILVTARTRPDESSTGGWTAILGWENPRLARTVPLFGLTRRGVEEALTSMGNPFNSMAIKVDIVGELSRLSEGDPLLVRLYVEALLAQGLKAATLRAEDLHQIKPGLGGYFERWWQDQREQWRIQGRNPITEQAHLRLLLNAIAASLGPLTLDDLAALHSDLADSTLLRELLEYVSRWLVGDGKGQGYSYSHPRLGYYFWEQLGSQEQQMWDKRFCAWGAETLNALNTNQIVPKATPVYLLRYYTSHLQRCQLPAEEFYALVSNGWRKAWEELDVSYTGFLNDVDRAWEQARQFYEPNKPRKANALVLQVKAALCKASVAAIGSNVSPELLVQAIETGLRTPQQALAMAKLATSERQQAGMISILAPHLPISVLEEAFAVAYSIEDPYHRIVTLLELATQLPKNDQILMIRKVIAIIRSIPYGLHRSYAFILLTIHLRAVRSRNKAEDTEPAKRRSFHVNQRNRQSYLDARVTVSNALVAAYTINDKGESALTLCSLIPKLPDPLLRESFTITNSLADERARSHALTALAPRLPKILMQELVTSAKLIKYEPDLAYVLKGLSTCVPNELVGEVLDIACSMRNAVNHISVLIELAPRLSETMLTRCLTYFSSYQHESGQALLLGFLARHLPRTLLNLALDRARLIQNASSRSMALSNLVNYYPSSEQSTILSDILRAELLVNNQIDRVRGLRRLLPHLLEKEKEEAAVAALISARSIEDASARVRALGSLIPYVAVQEKSAVRIAALEAARSINDVAARSHALGSLIPHVTDEEKKALHVEALMAARSIKGAETRAHALGSLVSYVVNEEKRAICTEALAAVRLIKGAEARVIKLEYLASIVPIDERQAMFAEAFVAARLIGENYTRAAALSRLAPYLSDVDQGLALTTGLATASSIIDDYLRGEALGGLIQSLHVWTKRTPLSAYISFSDVLALLSHRPRPQFLRDLTVLTPWLLALAGDEAPQAAEGIFHAIQDVCAWWP